MRRKLLALSLLLGCTVLPAHAVGRLADVVVVDRATGATLPTHYHRGEYWVAGTPGGRYAVSVRNKTGERLLAVTSVDGVNVLSGETASWEQNGYVFGSFQGYQIPGWRKSSSEVAAFEFSSAGDSYAGLTGRPANLGVIGVALFRERQPEPMARAPELSHNIDAAGAPAQERRRESLAPAPASAGAAAADAARSESAAPRALPPEAHALQAPKLGTAHGQREASVVSHTRFERMQTRPDELISIRYDSRENLVASGVIRAPVRPRPGPGANPFPLSDQAVYVPDPPLRRY